MKRMKSILLAGCMLAAGGLSAVGLTACSTTDYTVGILQLVTHSALDAATQGFRDTLQAKMDEANKTIEFDYQNAQNDTATCTTIANKFVSGGYDLILANATPALQACVNSTTSIPILGTSVTLYSDALGLKDFDDDDPAAATGINVSGTSDLAPLADQAQMILDMFPEAKTVGLLYCSAESNSKYQVDQVAAYLEAKGIESKHYGFTDSNDISAVTTAAAAACDVIYVPTDNTAASNANLIDNICRPAGVPIIAGEEGICSGCGVAALSISYYNLGVKTGEMAAKILLEGADVAEMPVEKISKEECSYVYNAAICEALGVTPPEGYTAIGAEE